MEKSRVEKTVFISYRHFDLPLALLIFKDLTLHGYDVFIDYDGIGPGDFEQVIVENIRSRAHFLVVLTPQAIADGTKTSSWLCRETEAAIKAERNIVPLMFHGFDFSSPSIVKNLSGGLSMLPNYNGLEIPLTYFDQAMDRLRTVFLSRPLDTVLHPASDVARDAAAKQQASAAVAVQKQASIQIGGDADSPSPEDHAIRPQASQATAFQLGKAEPRFAPDAPMPALAIRTVVLIGGVVLAVAGLVAVWKFVGTPHSDQAVVTQAPVTTEPTQTPQDGGSTAVATSEVLRGDDYFYGRNGRIQSDDEAVKWYRRSAAHGDPSGQYKLGFMFQKGRGGLAKSDQEAVEWYRLAADQGFAAAQVQLGLMYAKGRGGVQKSDTDAVRWIRLAADQGFASGQAYLAVMYLEGRGGLNRDEALAVSLARKSADQGDAIGQSTLGTMYAKGVDGLPKNEAEAMKWPRRAADQGFAFAQGYLGATYLEGVVGLAKIDSDIEALKWTRLAADQGDEVGQANLGFMYETGRGGLSQSRDEAVNWYRRAAEQGNAVAKEALQRLKASK